MCPVSAKEETTPGKQKRTTHTSRRQSDEKYKSEQKKRFPLCDVCYSHSRTTCFRCSTAFVPCLTASLRTDLTRSSPIPAAHKNDQPTTRQQPKNTCCCFLIAEVCCSLKVFLDRYVLSMLAFKATPVQCSALIALHPNFHYVATCRNR